MSRSRRLTALPLNSLKAFEVAARLNSFKLAAEELGVTPAAVSHHIKALESHAGIHLFNRLHRGLQITGTGEKLATALTASFSIMENALDELADAGLIAGPRTLTVSCAPTIAAKWLAPRVHSFQRDHPQLSLKILASDHLADLTNRREVDFAVRYGPGSHGPEVVAHKLWPGGSLITVCSPELVTGQGLVELEDVFRFPLIRTASPQQGNPREPSALTPWLAWLDAAGLSGSQVEVAVKSGPFFGATHLALEAAAAGQGIALCPSLLAMEDLRLGRLCQPFSISVTDQFYYWLLYRRDRANEARIQAFAAWALKQCAVPP